MEWQDGNVEIGNKSRALDFGAVVRENAEENRLRVSMLGKVLEIRKKRIRQKNGSPLSSWEAVFNTRGLTQVRCRRRIDLSKSVDENG